jgi:hypothetical protein
LEKCGKDVSKFLFKKIKWKTRSEVFAKKERFGGIKET